MKKTSIFIASLVVLLVSVSAHTSRVIAPEVGHTVPALSIESGDSVISLSDYKGNYLLLTFWESTDAQSRVRCNEYERLLAKDAKICRLSINLDRNKRLFQEIVSNDNLDNAGQFNLTARQAEEVKADFGLNGSCRSFLIDPQGQVVAINPSAQDIARI